MSNGTVKWFNPTKGYGFITEDDGSGPDLFVHRRDIADPHDGLLMEGDRVTFERIETPRGAAATNVGRDTTDVQSFTGTVKWFNTTKGFGFITPDSGGADLFMHQDNLRMAGHIPQEGDRVVYETMQTAKGFAARNVVFTAPAADEAELTAYDAQAAF